MGCGSVESEVQEMVVWGPEKEEEADERASPLSSLPVAFGWSLAGEAMTKAAAPSSGVVRFRLPPLFVFFVSSPTTADGVEGSGISVEEEGSAGEVERAG